MSPSHSAFTYAVVRVVPDIEREEFVNAGLILFDRERSYLAARTRYQPASVDALRAGCDHDAIRRQLDQVVQVAAGEVATVPFATMTQSERFHWLTTPRSTVIQPGPSHTGVTDDPQATFEHLFGLLVDR
jgi:hypothetical protein